jgi:5-methylcytosine-specific restriction protein A
VSNARKSPVGNRYRSGYLKSVSWFRRRDHWFAEQESRTNELRCVVCSRPATRRQLELHHLDYTRVIYVGARWIAGEVHEDLCAMHPTCHDSVHRVLDSDPVLRGHRTRPVATIHAIHIARTRTHAATGLRP